MYVQITYATAKERQAEFLREAAQRRVQREAEKAQRNAERPAEDAHAPRLPETSLFATVKRNLATVGARIMAL
jgi:hypothetical protein